MSSNRVAFTGIACLLALALCVPGMSAWAQELSGSITVASLLSNRTLSNFDAWHAPHISTATRLAEADFNGYLKGSNATWSLEISYNNTQSDPDRAVDAVSWYAQNGTRLFSGPPTSAELSDVRNTTDALFVSCCSSDPSLKIRDMAYRLVYSDTDSVLPLNAMFQDEGISTLVVLAVDNRWGRAYHDVTSDTYAGTITSIMFPEGLNASQAGDTIDILYDAVAPLDSRTTGILVASHSPDAAALFRAASGNETLERFRWYGSNTNADAEEIINTDAAAFAERVGFRAPAFTVGGNDKTDMIDRHMPASLPERDLTYAYAAYDSVWLVGLAIRDAGSTDPVAVNGSIYSMAATPDTFALDGSGLRLDEFGDLSPQYTIRTIINGTWEDLPVPQDAPTIPACGYATPIAGLFGPQAVMIGAADNVQSPHRVALKSALSDMQVRYEEIDTPPDNTESWVRPVGISEVVIFGLFDEDSKTDMMAALSQDPYWATKKYYLVDDREPQYVERWGDTATAGPATISKLYVINPAWCGSECP